MADLRVPALPSALAFPRPVDAALVAAAVVEREPGDVMDIGFDQMLLGAGVR